MMRFILPPKFAAPVLVIFSLIGATLGQTARWDKASATRAYNEILREYNQTKTRLNENLSEADHYAVVTKLQDLRFQAQQIHFDLEIVSGTNPELQRKFRDLAASLTTDIQTLRTRGPAASAPQPGERDSLLYDELEELAARTDPTDVAAVSQTLDRIIDQLAIHKNTDPDAARLSAVLEIERERRSINSSRLATILNRPPVSPITPSRRVELNEARLSLIDLASHYLLVYNQANTTSRDVAVILDLAKYLAQVYDDIKDPNLTGGSSSAVTRLVRRMAGVAKLYDSTREPEGQKMVSALRDTIGTLETRIRGLDATALNPMKAFDVPAEVAAAMIDTSRKGMDQTSQALNDIGKAIEGDAVALGRLPDHAKQIEATLSPQSYGKAMATAIGNRLLDRVPFLRALVKLSSVGGEGRPSSTSARREPHLPELLDPSRIHGSNPEHPLAGVIGVWHIKIQSRPDEPPVPEGHIVIPGKGYTWNIFRDATWSNSVDVNRMKLSGAHFTMTNVPWFWVGDRVYLQLSSDGHQMDGLWISSHHDADKSRFRATLTRVYPRVTSQKVLRTGKNSITLEYTGTGLPIDDRIHGRGMVEFSSPGMHLAGWDKDPSTGAMRIMITHDDNAPKGTKTVWLNGVAYDWRFQ